MNELIRYLMGWQAAAGEAARPLPEKPKKPASRGKPKYPAGATEAEKLRIGKERIRKEREAAEAAKPRDVGGPFGKLPGKIGAGMKKAAGKKPDPDAKKPWYRKGLRDLF